MPDTVHRKRIVTSARSIVVKIGTNVLARPDGSLAQPVVRRLAGQIAILRARGLDVTVVSSGAIGAGVGQLRLGVRPKSTAMLQATAAVGQPVLIDLFNQCFAKHGLRAAQMLLTRSDFEDRRRFLNVRNTIAALHQFATIPVINENDTVATDEIGFGDNDMLAALMSNLLRADLMILLTIVDGLLDGGEVVPLVDGLSRRVFQLATASKSALGTGGMKSKLAAIKMATDAGVAAMLASGKARHVLLRLMDGKKLGTVFAPAAVKMPSRKRWIGLVVRPVGEVVVDDGAARALRTAGKSLLPIGVTDVRGKFGVGEVVRVVDTSGGPVGQGLVGFSSRDLSRIKGLKTVRLTEVLGRPCRPEVVHRNNLVLADPPE